MSTSIHQNTDVVVSHLYQGSACANRINGIEYQLLRPFCSNLQAEGVMSIMFEDNLVKHIRKNDNETECQCLGHRVAYMWIVTLVATLNQTAHNRKKPCQYMCTVMRRSCISAVQGVGKSTG